jgi:SAM-dependent methyltransferase
MHKATILRMKWFVDNFIPENFTSKLKVLDIGSYNVNGSYKDLFDPEKFEYTGLDIEKGPNVDIVVKNPYVWEEVETDSYDIVISGQTFEHAEFFWVTMSEMTRVLKKDGLLCVIAPNVLQEHRYPVDCYRFYSDGMIALCRYVSIEPLHAHTNCAPANADPVWYSNAQTDTMLVARKPYAGNTIYLNLKEYNCNPADQQQLKSGLIPFREKNFIFRHLRKYLNNRDYKKQQM